MIKLKKKQLNNICSKFLQLSFLALEKVKLCVKKYNFLNCGRTSPLKNYISKTNLTKILKSIICTLAINFDQTSNITMIDSEESDDDIDETQQDDNKSEEIIDEKLDTELKNKKKDDSFEEMGDNFTGDSEYDGLTPDALRKKKKYLKAKKLAETGNSITESEFSEESTTGDSTADDSTTDDYSTDDQTGTEDMSDIDESDNTYIKKNENIFKKDCNVLSNKDYKKLIDSFDKNFEFYITNKMINFDLKNIETAKCFEENAEIVQSVESSNDTENKLSNLSTKKIKKNKNRIQKFNNIDTIFETNSYNLNESLKKNKIVESLKDLKNKSINLEECKDLYLVKKNGNIDFEDTNLGSLNIDTSKDNLAISSNNTEENSDQLMIKLLNTDSFDDLITLNDLLETAINSSAKENYKNKLRKRFNSIKAKKTKYDDGDINYILTVNLKKKIKVLNTNEDIKYLSDDAKAVKIYQDTSNITNYDNFCSKTSKYNKFVDEIYDTIVDNQQKIVSKTDEFFANDIVLYQKKSNRSLTSEDESTDLEISDSDLSMFDNTEENTEKDIQTIVNINDSDIDIGDTSTESDSDTGIELNGSSVINISKNLEESGKEFTTIDESEQNNIIETTSNIEETLKLSNDAKNSLNSSSKISSKNEANDSINTSVDSNNNTYDKLFENFEKNMSNVESETKGNTSCTTQQNNKENTSENFILENAIPKNLTDITTSSTKSIDIKKNDNANIISNKINTINNDIDMIDYMPEKKYSNSDNKLINIIESIFNSDSEDLLDDSSSSDEFITSEFEELEINTDSSEHITITDSLDSAMSTVSSNQKIILESTETSTDISSSEEGDFISFINSENLKFLQNNNSVLDLNSNQCIIDVSKDIDSSFTAERNIKFDDIMYSSLSENINSEILSNINTTSEENSIRFKITNENTLKDESDNISTNFNNIEQKFFDNTNSTDSHDDFTDSDNDFTDLEDDFTDLEDDFTNQEDDFTDSEDDSLETEDDSVNTNSVIINSNDSSRQFLFDKNLNCPSKSIKLKTYIDSLKDQILADVEKNTSDDELKSESAESAEFICNEELKSTFDVKSKFAMDEDSKLTLGKGSDSTSDEDPEFSFDEDSDSISDENRKKKFSS